MAAEALAQGKVNKIVLCRPSVEVGASIGFLPGTETEKVTPFMRPLFDELSYYFSNETVRRLMFDGVIELAPLSLMRGRTFRDSFIILDEAQNATLAELKLFLTRIGGGSKMVITGDITQSDIDNTGLEFVLRRLEGMDKVGIIKLQEILRNSIIDEILERLI